MTAYWKFFAHTGYAVSTSSAAAAKILLNSASALSFSGGVRRTADFQANININEWNSSMMYAKSTAEVSTDYCPAPHLWAVFPSISFAPNSWLRATACYLSTSIVGRATATYFKLNSSGARNPNVHTSRGITLYFANDTTVRCAPVTIWAGTGSAVDKRPTGCYIAMCDLSSGVAGSPTWATVTPTVPLTLKPHGTTGLQHYWSVGIAVMPTQVGFNGLHKMRVQATYY